MAAVSRNRRQQKQQSVVALLLLTMLCSNDTLTVLAVPSSYESSLSQTNAEGSSFSVAVAV